MNKGETLGLGAHTIHIPLPCLSYDLVKKSLAYSMNVFVSLVISELNEIQYVFMEGWKSNILFIFSFKGTVPFKCHFECNDSSCPTGASVLSGNSVSLCTFLVADTADDVTAGGDRQLTVGAGGQEAGVAVDPKRHLKTCEENQVASNLPLISPHFSLVDNVVSSTAEKLRKIR